MEKKNNGLLIPIIVGAVLLALAAVLLIFLLLPSGGDKGAQDKDIKDPAGAQTLGSVSIEVVTEGKKPLPGIGVYVYSDSALKELVWFEKTGEDGKISFEAESAEKLYALLKDVPEGYATDDYYEITGSVTEIILKTVLVSTDDLTDVKYETGDVIGDFSVTDTEGKEFRISDLLKDKKAVVLFFWQMEGEACKEQIAFLDEAYQNYKDDIAILAMNPLDSDEAAVKEFKDSLSLSIPLALCEMDWVNVVSIDTYPTMVVVDQYGVVTLIQRGALPGADAYSDIFEFFADEDYVQSGGVDVDNITDTTLDMGSSGNPVEISGVEYFDVTVQPGKVVYYNIYKITNQYLQINDPNACIIYNGETIRATGGVVGVALSSPSPGVPVSIGIGNSGTEEKTFRATLSLPKGTMGNPYSLKIGEFSTIAEEGNSQGVYYNFVASEDGYLTVSCLSATSGVTYGYNLYNLRSYAYMTMDGDGVTDKDGVRSVSIKVKAGDTVQLSIGAISKGAEPYPRCEFRSKASFQGQSFSDDKVETVKKTVYAITVTDNERKPVSGARVRIISANGEEYSLTTDSNGVAGTKLVPGTYKAVLSVPVGYKATTTEFVLTEKIPTASVMITKTVVAYEIYTVKVVDTDGAPISGVTVFVGDRFAATDENGIAVFQLAKGAYVCVVAIPNGYTADTTSFAFNDKKDITVVLTKGAGTDDPNDPTKQAYSVTVTDYNGKPMKNVAVKFMSGDTLCAMATTDDSGVAAVRLSKGAYTASLAFDKNGYHYVDEANLTENAPAVTVRVATEGSGEYESLYVGDAYKLSVGGTYVQMQSNVVNYFVFEPTESGVYRFRTSDRNAVLSYWGGNVHYLEDMTANTNYAENSFSISVRESAIGIVFTIGITGADECIVEIVRTGDATIDEHDLPWTVYEAKKEPVKYILNLGAGHSLKAVDITGKTGNYTLVYNSADGYYHFNSANGPVALVNLGTNAPYVSIKTLLETTALRKYFYDANGTFVKKEDYTECMSKYVASIDDTYGVCPLTEDLMYIIKQNSSWWDPASYDYLFGDLSGVNSEIAWMFLLCYVG